MNRSNKPLKKVIIKRVDDHWHVIRERESNGESAICNDLEESFDFVRALYDKDGNQLEMF